MDNPAYHSFHIPVMGLAFTVDTPLKVARFGISSVMSIIEDELLEQMREYHSSNSNSPYIPISIKEEDYRARRITAYLDLIGSIVTGQMEQLRREPFEPGSDIVKYFELLPEDSVLKAQFRTMLLMDPGPEKRDLEALLRSNISPGAIDVNIMAKVDKTNYTENGDMLPTEYSDALSALRGFALSTLGSSVVLSAGYNPRLYSYIEQFADFFPDDKGNLKKRIILKVSDYRSAMIQGKILARKGIWVSEYRIESGLNCGGHAFATDGLLLGVILEEFKNKRKLLAEELLELCNAANSAGDRNMFLQPPSQRLTVQGGIGTSKEQEFLLEYYQVDGTGWGSPFLLVPEVTNVDDETLRQFASAKKEDYYLSNASPLGVPFNNFRRSSSEKQRLERKENDRPGSPCYKKFLSSNTEFTEQPICTASREYQQKKIKALQLAELPLGQLEVQMDLLTEKDCLCEGLGASVKLKNKMKLDHKLSAVAICPGPNLAYFSGTFSLRQLVDHIYGRGTITNALYRPDMFINELVLYVTYLRNQAREMVESAAAKQVRYLETFKQNLLEGIDYYRKLFPIMYTGDEQSLLLMQSELLQLETSLNSQKP